MVWFWSTSKRQAQKSHIQSLWKAECIIRAALCLALMMKTARHPDRQTIDFPLRMTVLIYCLSLCTKLKIRFVFLLSTQVANRQKRIMQGSNSCLFFNLFFLRHQLSKHPKCRDLKTSFEVSGSWWVSGTWGNQAVT